LLAWDQFIGSDNVGRVPIERKLARVPAPAQHHGSSPESQKACYKRIISQSITDHRSQGERKKRMCEGKGERDREKGKGKERKETRRKEKRDHRSQITEKELREAGREREKEIEKRET